MLPQLFSVTRVRLLIAALFLAAAALLWIPFRPGLLCSEGCINFACALGHFDLTQSSPQPPGYPLFVLQSRALLTLLGSPERAFVAGVFSGLTSTIRIYLAAVSCGVAWCCWRMWRGERGLWWGPDTAPLYGAPARGWMSMPAHLASRNVLAVIPALLVPLVRYAIVMIPAFCALGGIALATLGLIGIALLTLVVTLNRGTFSRPWSMHPERATTTRAIPLAGAARVLWIPGPEGAARGEWNCVDNLLLAAGRAHRRAGFRGDAVV